MSVASGAAELQAQLRAREAELDAAQRQLATMQHEMLMQKGTSSAAGPSAEEQKLRRQVEELQRNLQTAQAGAAERAALEEQATLLGEQLALLKQQLGQRGDEAVEARRALAMAQQEVEEQRRQLEEQQRALAASAQETAAAEARLRELKQVVAAEAVAAAEVLNKAEAAAQVLGQQLLEVMQSRQGDSEGEEEAWASRAAGGAGRLTSGDEDALLEELEYLQQQVAASQAVSAGALAWGLHVCEWQWGPGVGCWRV